MILVLVQQKLAPKEHHSRHAIITQKCTACRVLLLNYPSYLLSILFLLYLVWCLFILFNFPQLSSLPALRLWELKTFFPFILLPWGSSCLVTADRSHEGLRAQQSLKTFPTFKFWGPILPAVTSLHWYFTRCECGLLVLCPQNTTDYEPVPERNLSWKKGRWTQRNLTCSRQKTCMKQWLGVPHLDVLGWLGRACAKLYKKLLNAYLGVPWDLLH